jgi:hypothetical protein
VQSGHCMYARTDFSRPGQRCCEPQLPHNHFDVGCSARLVDKANLVSLYECCKKKSAATSGSSFVYRRYRKRSLTAFYACSLCVYSVRAALRHRCCVNLSVGGALYNTRRQPMASGSVRVLRKEGMILLWCCLGSSPSLCIPAVVDQITSMLW